jgi:DNA topoisomerase-3
MILQQVISTDDMRQLLTEGRTRFLNGFVSNRTKRRFTASLAISPEGKVGFEFDEKTKALIAKAKQKTNEASGRRS